MSIKETLDALWKKEKHSQNIDPTLYIDEYEMKHLFGEDFTDRIIYPEAFGVGNLYFEEEDNWYYTKVYSSGSGQYIVGLTGSPYKAVSDEQLNWIHRQSKRFEKQVSTLNSILSHNKFRMKSLFFD